MDNLHQKLMDKQGWYRFWHSRKGHQATHWLVLGVVALLFTGLLVARIENVSFLAKLQGLRGQAAATAPQLPNGYLANGTVMDTRISSMAAGDSHNTITVAAGGDFQAALNSAQLGDEIVLAAGATYTAPGGGFVLPNKTGNGWITIRTSNMAGIPSEGQRVTPANAAAMPKIVSTTTAPALVTAANTDPITGSTAPAGPHNYRFIGVELSTSYVAPAATPDYTNYGIVYIGRSRNKDSNGVYVPDQVALNQVPHHIVFDRVYVHGNATGNVTRGISLNSAYTAVVDSYIADIHDRGNDAQALASWNGPGPFKIVDNYLSASGENVMFGGADSASSDLIPSDIEILRNHIIKPLSWKPGDPTYAGIDWSIKNLMELKSARRVIADGNVMEHSWTDSQQGWCLVITPRNQEGTAPWSTVEDITFTNNVCRDTNEVLDILGHDDNNSSQQLNRVRIANNLFEQANGNWLVILHDTANMTVDHNTAFQRYNVATVDRGGITALNSHFTYTNNITMPHDYGFFASGGGEGTAALNGNFTDFIFAKNVVTGREASVYPSNNFFPVTIPDIGFVNYNNGLCGDYHLAATSLYKNAGTDGRDIGADIDALNTATAGAAPTAVCATGATPPPPPPADSTAPATNITAPAAGATVSGSVTVSAAASDNVGVAKVEFYGNGSLLATDTAAPYSVTWNTAAIANGSYNLQSKAYDTSNNTGSSAAVAVTVSNATSGGSDTVSPVANLTAPAAGATVSGTVSMTATASDNVGVDIVYFVIDGVAIGSDTTAPYTFNWNTTSVANGSHTLHAVAWDTAHNSGTSAGTQVTVSNQAVSNKSHLNLSATTVSFNAVSGDLAPAAKTVTLSNSGSATSSWSASNSLPWCHVTPTSGALAAGGSASLSVSVDAPSNVGTFTCTISIVDANADNSPQNLTVSYQVDPAPAPNATPAITSFSVSSKNSNSATINWTTDQATTGAVKYGISKSNLNLTVSDSVSKTSHSVTINGLSSRSTYYYQITASNSNGSAATIISSFRTKPK